MSCFAYLASMWQLPHPVVVALVLASTAVCLLSALLFVLLKKSAAVHLFALALFFFGLSSLYSVVTPPFQAPDEPTHFLSLLETVGRKAEAPAVLAWAKGGYFLDLKLDPELTYKFAYDGRYPPLEKGYDNLFTPVDMAARSALTVSVWKLMEPLLASLNLNYALLAVRLLNGLMVTLFYGAALYLCWRLGPGPGDEQRGLSPAVAGATILLYVPTLPFFAMHVSNYPFLLGGGVLCAAIALVVLFGGARPPWLGALLGFSTFWLMFSARGGFVFCLLALLLVAAGGVLPALRGSARESGPPAVITASARFWGGLVSGWGASWLLFGRYDLKPVVAGMESALPGWLAQLLGGGWVLLAIPLALLLVQAAAALLPPLGAGSGIARGASFLGLFLFSVGLVGPFFQSSHHLRNIEAGAAKGPAVSYVRDVLIGFWGSQGLAVPDRFLVKYFWNGFGWLENLPRTDAVVLLTLPFFVGGLYLWWKAFNSGSGPETARLMVWATACSLYLAALAYGAWSIPVNLHGRYLILLYLIYLPVGFSGFNSLLGQGAELVAKRAADRRLPCPHGERMVAAALMLSFMAIHSLSVKSQLTRYFG